MDIVKFFPFPFSLIVGMAKAIGVFSDTLLPTELPVISDVDERAILSDECAIAKRLQGSFPPCRGRMPHHGVMRQYEQPCARAATFFFDRLGKTQGSWFGFILALTALETIVMCGRQKCPFQPDMQDFFIDVLLFSARQKRILTPSNKNYAIVIQDV